jgi:polyisoprenyl-teichoic acid--peptidoglycan teichoic acid transferase
MSRRVTGFFELLLLVVVVLSLGMGVTWGGGPAQAVSAPEQKAAAGDTPSVAQQQVAGLTQTPADSVVGAASPASATGDVTATATAALQPGEVISDGALLVTPLPLSTSEVFSGQIALDSNDAPLLVQAPGTINILLLGSDASANENLARTDTILVASINPDMPSVSLLSFPRDLQVRIPDHVDDRINTAFELGYIFKYPGGGPAFLAAVLRKNFGIKIDHYVRIDFAGFVKAVDQLGGVDVLAECELHDTFPDLTVPAKKSDLDIYPGKVSLNGKQALWYARSRWSTTDFDRARRQQKVLRALFSKVKGSNLLQNALGLYKDFQENIDTDVGLTMIPAFVDIARRLDDIAIKNRVITYPVVKSFTRKDGAQVLLPTKDTITYIADALSPPAGNRAQSRPRVEVFNASGKQSMKDMELVAAERLTWEGFLVVAVGKSDMPPQPKTQIFDFTTTPKGSPISRLQSIFNVRKADVIAQPDPSSVPAARIVLGDDYNSCPSTASIAGDVTLAPDTTDLIPTSTPQP